MSVWDRSVFGPPALVPGASSAFEDDQPNPLRDGLELFFFSNRTGTLGLADSYYGSTRPGGEGSTDHYVTTREKPATA